MATEKIPAETRTEFGKGAARRIRRDNKIPAVVYGHGNDAVHVTLPGHDTMMAIKHGGANALLELEIEGKGQLALTKAVQIDPIRRIIEHIDFVAVRRGEKVTVDVPVHLHGSAASETLVVTENSTVQIEAEATNIPERIEIVDRGTSGWHPDPGLPARAARGIRRCWSTRETLIVNITEQQSEEALEAELEEAEAEAGIEREEPTSPPTRSRLPRVAGPPGRTPLPRATPPRSDRTSRQAATGAEPWVVLGLGNPGPAYAGHRHNVGYLVADELVRRLGTPFTRPQGQPGRAGGGAPRHPRPARPARHRGAAALLHERGRRPDEGRPEVLQRRRRSDWSRSTTSSTSRSTPCG